MSELCTCKNTTHECDMSDNCRVNVRIAEAAKGMTQPTGSTALAIENASLRAQLREERLDDDEKGVSSIHTPSGAQEMTAFWWWLLLEVWLLVNFMVVVFIWQAGRDDDD